MAEPWPEEGAGGDGPTTGSFPHETQHTASETGEKTDPVDRHVLPI
jgi:hypothetical protein